jgi:hypothetical protein
MDVVSRLSHKTKGSKKKKLHDVKVAYESTPKTSKYFVMDSFGIRSELLDINSGKVQHTIEIISEPVELIDCYISGSGDMYFETKINGATVCDTKENIVKHLQLKTCFIRTRFISLVSTAIGSLFSEIIKRKKIKPKSMFPAVGIFKNSKENFVLTYPKLKGIKVFAENAAQQLGIDNIGKKKLDLKGILGKYFYNLLKLKQVPDTIKFITMGYVAIEPFFEALKDKLDIFPNIFWVHHLSSVGKSSFFELIGNHLYGTDLLSKDNVNSISRLTMFLTSTTFPLVIDDINDLKPDLLDILKSPSTNRTARMRLNKDQQMKVSQTLCSIMGTANSKNFLSGRLNQAFRDRSLIFTKGDPIKDDKNSRIWDDNYYHVKTGPIFGAYFLQTSIKYFGNYKKGNTDYNNFLSMYQMYLDKIKKGIKARLIKTLSRRRVEMYVLVYIGMKLWEHVFDSLNLDFKELKEFLDLNNDAFFESIKDQEAGQKSSSGAEFEQILAFFEEYRWEDYHYTTKFGKRKFESLVDTHGIPVVKSDFVTHYDEWARRKGYETLGSLTQLAELESSLLQGSGKDIRKKTIVVRTPREAQGVTSNRVSGVPLYVEDIKKLIESDPLKDLSGSTAPKTQSKSKQKQKTLNDKPDIDAKSKIIKKEKKWSDV